MLVLGVGVGVRHDVCAGDHLGVVVMFLVLVGVGSVVSVVGGVGVVVLVSAVLVSVLALLSVFLHFGVCGGVGVGLSVLVLVLALGLVMLVALVFLFVVGFGISSSLLVLLSASVMGVEMVFYSLLSPSCFPFNPCLSPPHSPFYLNTNTNLSKYMCSPKEDKGVKRKLEGEDGVAEELLAALHFADLEGTAPPWASSGPTADREHGGLTEKHIQVHGLAAASIMI